MKIEHLVAVMKQKDFEIFSKMNLDCDAVIANQYNVLEYKEKIINGSNIKMVTTNTIGVGKNRNIGLIYSSGDICILSDDDMVYNENYIKIIKEAFKKLPDADIIIFNIKTIGNESIKRRTNTKIKKINKMNFMNYGAARIAFKRSSVINNNIWFSTKFGGGAMFSSGEDTLFLLDAIKTGLKIYTYPKEIAKVDQSTSSWFLGYNEKFFYDKGALIGQIYPILKYLFIFIYFPLKFESNLSFKRKIQCLLNGMKNYKKNISYDDWIKK